MKPIRAMFLLLVLSPGGLVFAPEASGAPEAGSLAVVPTRPVASEVVRGAIASGSLDESELERARLWGLEDAEYKRYRLLMQGVRGSFSVPGISPLEVLGIHAETPAERRRYAERLVRMLFEDTERVQSFQREVDAAWKRLYPATPMINVSLLPAGHRPFRLLDLAGKRLAVFVAAGCKACTAALPRLLSLVGGEQGIASGLDIYVIDAANDGAIRTWARKAGVDPALVRARRVTLNHGRALFDRLGGDRSLPQVYVRDGGRLVPAPARLLARGAR